MLSFHQFAGNNEQNGGSFVMPVQESEDVETTLPLKINVSAGKLYTRYTLSANSTVFPDSYGWRVAKSVETFLTTCEIALAKLLMRDIVDNIETSIPMLKLGFAFEIQNKQEIGPGIEPLLMSPREWHVSPVEAIGLLPSVQQHFSHVAMAKVIYNSESGSSVYFHKYVSFKLEVFQNVDNQLISDVFGGNPEAVQDMLLVPYSSSEADSSDEDEGVKRPVKKKKCVEVN